MGWIRHHALIVTASADDIEKAKTAADDCFGTGVCVVSDSFINDYATLLVPADGSKEGWQESKDGDGVRDRFVKWLDASVYEDGSSPYSWVEVEYAETLPSITRHGGNHS